MAMPFTLKKMRLLGGLYRQDSLRAIAARGAAWTAIGFGSQYALKLVSTLVLTRLLAPDAFGLMSLATVFLAGLNLLSDIGTTPSIIRSRRAEEPDFLRTAWTLQAVRGVVIALAACLLAWPISQLYDEPLLFPMISALAMTAVVQGLASIAIPLAQRNMALRQLTLLEISVQAVATAATILFAWLLHSVWALVFGALIGTVFRVALSHLVLQPFRHGFQIERATVAEIVTFGRWILLGTLLTFLAGKGVDAIQGALVPIDILGLLSISGMIGWALGDLATKVLGNVAFPALSKQVRDNPQAVQGTLRKIQLAIAIALLPAFLMLSWLADDLVGLLYDDRYAQAGSFLSLTALNSALGVLSMPYQNAMLATGDSRFHAVVMGFSAAFRIAGLFIGFHLGGIYGMLAGVGVATGFTHLISATFAYRRGIANLPLDAVTLGGLAGVYALALQAVMGS